MSNRIELLLQENYLVMPWKNGQGSTAQIEIDSEGKWRLSAATVSKPGPFSEYHGMQRLLSIWRGEGLLLNDHVLKREEVYSFSGDLPVYCQNLSPVVIDLGLIFDPNRCSATMRHLNVSRIHLLEVKSDISFLFARENSFVANGLRVEEGDSLKVHGALTLEVGPVKNQSGLVLVELAFL